jgi:CelD/BcsL family acetyltransferase involved in cellulose biosynthesis
VNIYSDPQFCQALQAAYYPNQSLELKPFVLGSRTWQLPTLNGQEPMVMPPVANQFVDFYEPLAVSPAPLEALPQIRYLPKACHGIVSAQQWRDQHQQLEQSYRPAPAIWLEQLGHWKMSKKGRLRYRRLEKALGPVRFELNEPTPEVIAAGMRWKSAQYIRCGDVDLFALPAHVLLFKHLAESGLLMASSLRAGDRLLAVHLGLAKQGKLYWWVPSHDTDYNPYSPGKILLESAIQCCRDQGYEELDFLIGGEDYKWDYATHARLIGEMGVRPLPVRLKQLARNGLRRFPSGFQALKDLRAQVRQRQQSAQRQDPLELLS